MAGIEPSQEVDRDITSMHFKAMIIIKLNHSTPFFASFLLEFHSQETLAPDWIHRQGVNGILRKRPQTKQGKGQGPQNRSSIALLTLVRAQAD